MTTLAQWTATTRDYLDGNLGVDGNQLAVDYTAGSGTVTLVNALGNLGAGSWLSIGTNTLLVLAVNTLTKTASVVGGQRGSTDQSSTAGSLVLVNPRFTDYQIYRELTGALKQMSAPNKGVYQVATVEIPYSGQVEGFDLTGVTGFLKVLEVRRQTFGPSLAWPEIPTTLWDVYRSAPSDFASGIALRVRGATAGLSVQLVYAKAFGALAIAPATDVATTGIPDTADDIPPIGAAIRLMSGREIPRNQTDVQGSTRRANEVPPGAVRASYQGLVQLWLDRVKDESDRLRAMYPVSA